MHVVCRVVGKSALFFTRHSMDYGLSVQGICTIILSNSGGDHVEESTASNDTLVIRKIIDVGDSSTLISENDDKLKDLKSRDSTSQAMNVRDKMKIPNNIDEGVVDSSKVLILPSIGGSAINNKSVEHKDKDIKHVEELFLPPIASAERHTVKSDQNVNDREDGDDLITEESRDVSVSSLEQLEQLTFPFFEKQARHERDEVECEANINSEGKEVNSSSIDSTVPAPRLKLDNLPWPLILQYMRESESLSSEYFGLDNKEAVESRIAHNKRLQQSTSEDGLHTHRSRHLNSTSEAVVCDTESETDGAEEQEESETCQICDFCGQTSPKISLLQLAESKV